MKLLTFNEILTKMCDDFDELITPKRIARRNTNIIYLMFKAIAKGYELINNICVTLSYKFDPVNCSEEDLISVADLVGTERLKGSASGLEIVVRNESEVPLTLFEGTYTYKLDEDNIFDFEVPSDNEIEGGDVVSYIAFSRNIGKFPVTEQDSITVTSEVEILGSLKFSCKDNASLLGTEPETTVAFRERINTDVTRQSSISELETQLRNLPYLFDARLVFNNNASEKTVDGIIIPPYHLAVFYSGAPRNEMAEIIAKNSIYPTVNVEATEEREGAVALAYKNEVFIDGEYYIYVIPFAKYEYDVKVNYSCDSTYVNTTEIENKIKTYLKGKFRSNVHKDYITEADIYNALVEMNLSGVKFLNVDLMLTGSTESLPYMEISKARIPYLKEADVQRVTNG